MKHFLGISENLEHPDNGLDHIGIRQREDLPETENITFYSLTPHLLLLMEKSSRNNITCSVYFFVTIKKIIRELKEGMSLNVLAVLHNALGPIPMLYNRYIGSVVKHL